MALEGFYRRPLPTPLVPFASEQGKQLFREALSEGHLEGYFALAEQFHTQAEPAFCGLGTLVVALNALGVDPGRLWKGPWRWYSEELLDCCVPLEQVAREGLTLEQFACLARCNGATAEVAYAQDHASPERFREAVRRATSDPGGGTVLAAAYERAALGQTGAGHFSPLGGYHAARDLVLVLDVARFKYPAHWAPLPSLWDAMKPQDPTTGRSRGYALLRRGGALSVLFRVAPAPHRWADALAQLTGPLPEGLRRDAPASAPALVERFLAHLGPALRDVLETLAQNAAEALSPEHRAQVDALRAGLRATEAHARMERALGGVPDAMSAELGAMLLFVCAELLEPALPEATRSVLRELTVLERLPVSVATEVRAVRRQLTALAALRCSPAARCG